MQLTPSQLDELRRVASSLADASLRDAIAGASTIVIHEHSPVLVVWTEGGLVRHVASDRPSGIDTIFIVDLDANETREPDPNVYAVTSPDGEISRAWIGGQEIAIDPVGVQPVTDALNLIRKKT